MSSLVHVAVSLNPEKTHFSQPTAPFDWRVAVGTLWSDTSGVPVLKICTSVTPITFVLVDAGGGGGGVPTGTGFYHTTAGVMDAASKLVDAADVNNNQITYAKMQDVSATNRFLGRITAGAGDTEELTPTQATSLLNNLVGDAGAGGTKGLVPAPAAGDAAANKFLKADGTWTAAGAPSSGIEILAKDFTNHATVGTTEETLFTYNLPAGKLAVDNQSIRITCEFTATTGATVKGVFIDFGATRIVSESLSSGAQPWRISAEVGRTGATTQKAGGVVFRGNASVMQTTTTPGETLSGGVTILVRGISSSGAGQLTLNYVFIEYLY